jgi:hypothetical protein
MPPLARAALVAALVTNPWAFALATPVWVLVFTTPLDLATAPPPTAMRGRSR